MIDNLVCIGFESSIISLFIFPNIWSSGKLPVTDLWNFPEYSESGCRLVILDLCLAVLARLIGIFKLGGGRAGPEFVFRRKFSRFLHAWKI